MGFMFKYLLCFLPSVPIFQGIENIDLNQQPLHSQLPSDFQPGEEDFNPQTWIGDFYDSETPMNEAIFPGSHNSASYAVTAESKKSHTLAKVLAVPPSIVPSSLIEPWSKTQEKNISQSLKDGIRYLDLRVEKHEGEWWLYHGLLAIKLEDAMENQITPFARQNPKEIILIDLRSKHSRKNKTDDGDLYQFIFNRNSSWDSLLFDNDKAWFGLTFGEVWKSGRNIMVDFDFRYLKPLFFSPWEQKETPEALEGYLRKKITAPLYRSPYVQKYSKCSRINQCITRAFFHVHQVILSPGPVTIAFGGLTGASSLKEMHQQKLLPRLNNIVEDLEEEALKDPPKVPTVMTSDFYHLKDKRTGKSFVRIILDLNRKRLRS